MTGSPLSHYRLGLEVRRTSEWLFQCLGSGAAPYSPLTIPSAFRVWQQLQKHTDSAALSHTRDCELLQRKHLQGAKVTNPADPSLLPPD